MAPILWPAAMRESVSTEITIQRRFFWATAAFATSGSSFPGHAWRTRSASATRSGTPNACRRKAIARLRRPRPDAEHRRMPRRPRLVLPGVPIHLRNNDPAWFSGPIRRSRGRHRHIPRRPAFDMRAGMALRNNDPAWFSAPQQLRHITLQRPLPCAEKSACTSNTKWQARRMPA
jgi:hypothetical protein